MRYLLLLRLLLLSQQTIRCTKLSSRDTLMMKVHLLRMSLLLLLMLV